MPKQKITQPQMNIIADALKQSIASWERKGNAKGLDQDLVAIYDRKAADVQAVLTKLTQGEIEL